MKFDPLYPHIGHTFFPGPLVIEGSLDEAIQTHAPVTFPAAGGQFDVRNLFREDLISGYQPGTNDPYTFSSPREYYLTIAADF